MKKIYPLLCAAILCVGLVGCDKEKDEIVNITVLPETVYNAIVPGNIWSDRVVYIINGDYTNISGGELVGFDHDSYERGYEYTFTAKKIHLSNPPQDSSSIEYHITSAVAKTRVITQDSEKEIELLVYPETVEYSPSYPYDATIYNAMRTQDVNAPYAWGKHIILKEIEGFTFESGYEYRLKVKKITTADPYSVRYVLVEEMDKQPKQE